MVVAAFVAVASNAVSSAAVSRIYAIFYARRPFVRRSRDFPSHVADVVCTRVVSLVGLNL